MTTLIYLAMLRNWPTWLKSALCDQHGWGAREPNLAYGLLGVRFVWS